MISIFLFIGIVLLLLIEGRLLGGVIFKNCHYSLLWALGYPMGVVLNWIVFLLLEITNITFSVITISIGHCLIFLVLGFLFWRSRRLSSVAQTIFSKDDEHSKIAILLTVFCEAVVIMVLINGAIHAFILPPSFWDTFTNWNMRTRVGMDAGTFFFPTASKAQYPILLHSLQGAVVAFLGWKEWAVNGITFMLSLTSSITIWIVVRMMQGARAASIVTASFVALPLAAVHFTQGYGDIHVAEYALIAALFFELYRRSQDVRMIAISALCVTGSAMTKLDGIYFAAIPWILFVCLEIIKTRDAHFKKKLLLCIAIPLCFSLVWLLYIYLQQLTITPHGTVFIFQPENIARMLWLTIATGSFGLYWFILPCVSFLLFWKKGLKYREFPVSFWWGILSIVLISGVFVFTHEVTGEFDILRALMLPTLLWAQGVALALVSRDV